MKVLICRQLQDVSKIQISWKYSETRTLIIDLEHIHSLQYKINNGSNLISFLNTKFYYWDLGVLDVPCDLTFGHYQTEGI